MSLLAFVLLGLMAFCWFFARSVRAGYGKLLFWLVYFIGGLCVLLAMTPRHNLLEQTIANGWAISVLALPIFWCYRWLRFRRQRP